MSDTSDFFFTTRFAWFELLKFGKPSAKIISFLWLRSQNQTNPVVKSKPKVSGMNYLTLKLWILEWLSQYPDTYGSFKLSKSTFFEFQMKQTFQLFRHFRLVFHHRILAQPLQHPSLKRQIAHSRHFRIVFHHNNCFILASKPKKWDEVAGYVFSSYDWSECFKRIRFSSEIQICNQIFDSLRNDKVSVLFEWISTITF